MASPQPTDSTTRISNELYTQILMRDFTKRQRAILDLILRLSYGCKQKAALIPLAKDFEVCGVQANKVRKELVGLQQSGVIDWDEQTNRYWLNKDYDTWRIEVPDQDKQHRFNELLRMNIQSAHDHFGHVQNGQDDQKSPRNMTKKVSESGPKRSYELPDNQDGTRADGVPIYKDIYKDKKISVREERSPLDEYLFRLLKAGNEVFHPYGISQKTAYDMAELLVKEMLPVELGYEALNVAKNIKGDESFARNKLRRWLQAGVKDTESARRHEDEIYGATRLPMGGANVEHSNNSLQSGRAGESASGTAADFIQSLIERGE